MSCKPACLKRKANTPPRVISQSFSKNSLYYLSGARRWKAVRPSTAHSPSCIQGLWHCGYFQGPPQYWTTSSWSNKAYLFSINQDLPMAIFVLYFKWLLGFKPLDAYPALLINRCLVYFVLCLTSCPCQLPGILPIAKSLKFYSEGWWGHFKVIANVPRSGWAVILERKWTEIVPIQWE